MAFSKKELAENYQKKTDREHILDAPDTYIGLVDQDTTEGYTFSDDGLKWKTFDWVPGLYKLFDEGIVNCRDHVIRMQQAIADKKKKSLPVTYIDIGISDDGYETFYDFLRSPTCGISARTYQRL